MMEASSIFSQIIQFKIVLGSLIVFPIGIITISSMMRLKDNANLFNRTKENISICF